MVRVARFALGVVLVGALAGPASAQVISYPVYPQPVFVQPMYSQPVYAQPVYVQPMPAFPGVRRGLQVIADPTLVLPPGSPFASGRQPSAYPVLDAAPNIVNLASISLFFTAASPALDALAFGLPPAIRAVRVLLVGPPPGVETRGETLLWVAQPLAFYVYKQRQHRLATGQARIGPAPLRTAIARRGLFRR